jgi:hypothetical protein
MAKWPISLLARRALSPPIAPGAQAAGRRGEALVTLGRILRRPKALFLRLDDARKFNELWQVRQVQAASKPPMHVVVVTANVCVS